MKNRNCRTHSRYEAGRKFKEKPDICNAIGAHHDEVEMTSLLAPIVQVCDAISGARPGARREIVEAYIKRLNDLEQLAMSYPGVTKTYAIQAGREFVSLSVQTRLTTSRRRTFPVKSPRRFRTK